MDESMIIPNYVEIDVGQNGVLYEFYPYGNDGLVFTDQRIPAYTQPGMELDLRASMFAKKRDGSFPGSGDNCRVFHCGIIDNETQVSGDIVFTEMQDCLSLPIFERQWWDQMLGRRDIKGVLDNISKEIGIDVPWAYPDLAGSAVATGFYRAKKVEITRLMQRLIRPLQTDSQYDHAHSMHAIEQLVRTFNYHILEAKSIYYQDLFLPLVKAGFPIDKLWWYFNGPSASAVSMLFSAPGLPICSMSITYNTMADTLSVVDIPETHRIWAYNHDFVGVNYSELSSPVDGNHFVDDLINRHTVPSSQIRAKELLAKPGVIYGVVPVNSRDVLRMRVNMSLAFSNFGRSVSVGPDDLNNTSVAIFSDGIQGTRDLSRGSIRLPNVTSLISHYAKPSGMVKVLETLEACRRQDDTSLLAMSWGHSGNPRHGLSAIGQTIASIDENYRRLELI